MEKAYNRQYFNNLTAPALNEDNVNAIDAGVDEIDNRVLEMHAKVFTAMKNEEERRENERKRIEAESGRRQEEAKRIEAESGRRQEETKRINGENSRISNEKNRNQDENKRIRQEYLRQQDTAEAIKNAQDATTEADRMAKECKDVIKRAEEALQKQAQLEATLNLLGAGQILDSVKSYFERAEALYQSMYFECDGETPSLRVVSPIFIDGATPAVRNMDIGVDFDGGTPTSRLLAV